MYNQPYKTKAFSFTRKAFFTGSTALRKGQGLCYDRDYTGTGSGELATDPYGYRDRAVEVCSTTNNRWFAGVSSEDYAARSGGQWIDIYVPGSVCEIWPGVDTTIAATYVTCSASAADSGAFRTMGFQGRGSAFVLETGTNIRADVTDGSATANGTALASTGSFTNAVAGDKVFVTGGDPQAAEVVVPGEYTIASVTDNDNVVLTASASTGLGYCNFWLQATASPTVLAYLQTGEESGLTEVISPNGDATVQSMVGGVTYIAGGYTVDTDDSIATLANGTIEGEKKAFKCLGALTTNDWLLTVTSGLKLDGSALATLEFDAAAEEAFLIWGSTLWRHIAGTAVEA